MASNGDRAQSAMAPRDALWGASWTATLVRPASDGISGGSRTRWRFQDTWASAADDLVCLQKKCPSGGSGAALRTTPPRTHARYHEQQNPRKDQEGGPDEPQVHRHQGRLEVRARARKRHFPIAERLVRAPKKPTRTIPPPTLTPRRPAFPRDSQGQGSQGDEGSVQARDGRRGAPDGTRPTDRLPDPRDLRVILFPPSARSSAATGAGCRLFAAPKHACRPSVVPPTQEGPPSRPPPGHSPPHPPLARRVLPHQVMDAPDAKVDAARDAFCPPYKPADWPEFLRAALGAAAAARLLDAPASPVASPRRRLASPIASPVASPPRARAAAVPLPPPPPSPPPRSPPRWITSRSPSSAR